MSGRTTGAAPRIAAICAVVALAAVSVAAAAGRAAPPRPGLTTLKNEAAALDVQANRTLLDLYAIDARLGSARTRLRVLEAQASSLRAQLSALTRRSVQLQHTLSVSQHQLGESLRLLYKQGDMSTIAVVLGASSLDDAVTKLDALDAVASQSIQVARATTTARTRLLQLRTALRARAASIAAAAASVTRAAANLAGARTARIAFLGHLRSSRRLAAAQIRSLERAAQRAEKKSTKLQAVPVVRELPAQTTTAAATTTAQTPTVAPTVGGRTLIVSSTGYSLPGHTATGLPVGPGVVAVDPAVIPLGTRLTVPGYGEAVAADVGTGVHGAMIDLWFPTLAQARAWGRRTVTVTLH